MKKVTNNFFSTKLGKFLIVMFSVFIVILIFLFFLNASKTAFDYKKSGDKKQASGDYSGAIKDYSKAIKLDPRFADAFLERGNIKNAIGDEKGAINDCDQAILINPYYAKAYYKRALVMDKINDHKTALLNYTWAIELDPDAVFALVMKFLPEEKKYTKLLNKEIFSDIISNTNNVEASEDIKSKSNLIGFYMQIYMKDGSYNEKNFDEFELLLKNLGMKYIRVDAKGDVKNEFFVELTFDFISDLVTIELDRGKLLFDYVGIKPTCQEDTPYSTSLVDVYKNKTNPGYTVLSSALIFGVDDRNVLIASHYVGKALKNIEITRCKTYELKDLDNDGIKEIICYRNYSRAMDLPSNLTIYKWENDVFKDKTADYNEFLKEKGYEIIDNKAIEIESLKAIREREKKHREGQH